MSEELSPFLPWAADEQRVQGFIEEIVVDYPHFNLTSILLREILRHVGMIEERLDNE